LTKEKLLPNGHWSELTPEHLAGIEIYEDESRSIKDNGAVQSASIKLIISLYDRNGIDLLFEYCKSQGVYWITIDVSAEPNMLLIMDKIAIFDAIWQASIKHGFDSKKILMLSGNYYVNDCIINWATKNPRCELRVKFKSMWDNFVYTMHPDIDPYTPYKDTIKPKLLTCLNRTMRTHRIDLCNKFYSAGMFHKYKDKHISTFIGPPAVKIPLFPLAPQDKHLIPNICLENKVEHTWTPKKDLMPSQSGRRELAPQHAQSGPEFYQAFHDTYYDLITEFWIGECDTHREYREKAIEHRWWRSELIISEKTWRAIYHRRPFIVLGEPGILKYLHQLGFKTFDNIFDESYDREGRYTVRLKLVMREVMKTLNIPVEELHETMYSDEMQDILEHNRNLFISYQNPINRNSSGWADSPLTSQNG
jgi:hypothetical protein